MQYLPKRAIGISLALYVATFIVAIVCGTVLHQDMSSMSTIDDSFWYIGMGSAFVLTAAFAYWYLQAKALKPSPKAGAYFGLTTIVVGGVLDYVMFSLGNANGANVDLIAYYSDPRFWVILAIVVATSAFVGSHLATERKK